MGEGLGLTIGVQWNSCGSLLASGSDDKTVMVWDGVRCRRVARLDTPHEGNIFSVVWLPGSEDGLLATGAGDCRVSVGSEVDTLCGV